MPVAKRNAFDQLVGRFVDCFDDATLKKLVAFRAGADLTARLDELAEKNQEGEISQKEKDEYEAIVSFGSLISLMQVYARERLKESNAA